MKKFFLILIICATQMYAMPVFYSLGSEKIIKVIDLPDDTDFIVKDGGFMDIGYFYKQANIFFIPLWNYDGHYVAYDEAGRYVNLDSHQLKAIANDMGVKIPASAPNLPFWDEWGGKLIVIGLVLAYLLLYFLSYREEKSFRIAETVNKGEKYD